MEAAILTIALSRSDMNYLADNVAAVGVSEESLPQACTPDPSEARVQQTDFRKRGR